MGKPAETFAGDAGLVDMLCEQAAFDFIMSLRMSAQEGETCGNALKIASLSHWLNPMDMKRLGGKYGGKVDQNVIKSAALGHSKNPDAFIDWFMDAEQYLLSAVPRAPKINIVHKVLFSHAFETNTKLLELV